MIPIVIRNSVILHMRFGKKKIIDTVWFNTSTNIILGFITPSPPHPSLDSLFLNFSFRLSLSLKLATAHHLSSFMLPVRSTHLNVNFET